MESPAETTQDASWQKDREDWLGADFHLLVASPAETTQDADPFELSASCVGVVS
jgi:hypothetical protein